MHVVAHHDSPVAALRRTVLLSSSTDTHVRSPNALRPSRALGGRTLWRGGCRSRSIEDPDTMPSFHAREITGTWEVTNAPANDADVVFALIARLVLAQVAGGAGAPAAVEHRRVEVLFAHGCLLAAAWTSLLRKEAHRVQEAGRLREVRRGGNGRSMPLQKWLIACCVIVWGPCVNGWGAFSTCRASCAAKGRASLSPESV